MTRYVACAVLLAAALPVACGDDEPNQTSDESPTRPEAPPVGVDAPIEVIERTVDGIEYVCFSREWVAFQGSRQAQVISDLSCVKS